MTPSRHPAAPRDFDNVLVRLPARIKQLVAETAQMEKVSQNSLIASAVLSIMLARDVRRMGYPDNVLALVRAIDERSGDGFPIFGGMPHADWSSVQPFLTMLVECDIVDGLATRIDSQMPETTLFAMNLTKVGSSIWPEISDWIRNAYSRKPVPPDELPLVTAGGSSVG